jgi:hypothetical protein
VIKAGIGERDDAAGPQTSSRPAEVPGRKDALHEVGHAVANRPVRPDVGDGKGEAVEAARRRGGRLLRDIQAQAEAGAPPSGNDTIEMMRGAAAGVEHQRQRGPQQASTAYDRIGHGVEQAGLEHRGPTLQLHARRRGIAAVPRGATAVPAYDGP